MLNAPMNSAGALKEVRNWSYTWDDGNKALLRSLFTSDEIANDYAKEGLVIGSLGPTTLQEEVAKVASRIEFKTRRLEGVIEQLKYIEPAPAVRPAFAESTPIDDLLHLLARFHVVARRMRSRYGGRPPLEIVDEYDVQYLLGGLLAIDFADVRPEEHVPSYAGSSTRIDHLLKDDAIVVESKITRAKHADKEIGEELIIDIAKYRAHPDAKDSVCLIYDPNGYIANPAGLVKDLERLRTDELDVIVVISPGA